MSAADFDIEAYIRQMAALTGLVITPVQMPGVTENVQRIAGMARLFLDFPLPDDCELASMFKP